MRDFNRRKQEAGKGEAYRSIIGISFFFSAITGFISADGIYP